MADYATVDEIKQALSDSIQSTTTSYDVLLAALATRASRLLDAITGRTANAFQAQTSSTRYFDGNGRVLLAIDEVVSISAVANSDDGGTTWTSWASTDWIAQPYNTAPYMGLLASPYGTWGYWPSGLKNVKVTGVFGYSAEPPGIITQAVIMQACRWFKRGQSAFGDAFANADLGGLQFTKRIDPEVEMMVNDSGVRRLAI